MEKTRDELKNKFKKGDKPTEVDYANFMDSYVNKLEDPYFKFNDLPEADTRKKGIVQQATAAEVVDATNTLKYVSPLGVKDAIDNFAVTSVNGNKGEVNLPIYTPEDTGWKTPLNTTNLTLVTLAGSETIQYRKIVGVVHLTGEFKINSSATGTTDLFKIDTVPSKNTIFYVKGADNSMVRIQIDTAGQVACTNNRGTTISLTGLSFVAK